METRNFKNQEMKWFLYMVK